MDLLETILFLVVAMIFLYVLVIFITSFYFARVPRSIYGAYPDFGIVEEHRIPVKGKEIELWVIKQEIETEKTVIVTHSWGRDRSRYIGRAKKWFDMGFNTIVISVRDHGNSDRIFTGMNLIRFKEDVDATVNWWGKPVFLHGHSAGGGASILVGAENPLIQGVVAESPPRVYLSGLNEFFKPFSKKLTRIFYPGVKYLFRLLYFPYKNYQINPILAAANCDTPMLMMYALDDEVFNDVLRMVREWEVLPNVEVALFQHGKHSTISKQPHYKDEIEKFVQKVNNSQE